MITAALILYAIGIVLTLRYLLALASDIPREELRPYEWNFAYCMFCLLSFAWPVFWAWLLWDMWRE